MASNWEEETADNLTELNTIIRQAEPNDARALLGLTQQVGKETNYLTFGPEDRKSVV